MLFLMRLRPPRSTRTTHSFPTRRSSDLRIATRCVPTLKRLVLELGGHAPFIVFADADIDRAVESCLSAKFATSGQDCLAANRIFVERPIYDRFAAAFADRKSTRLNSSH